MVITEEKKFQACEMVAMGVDRELVHELRIATMTALEGLKEDSTGEIQVSGYAKRIIGECPPPLMQERLLDTLERVQSSWTLRRPSAGGEGVRGGVAQALPKLSNGVLGRGTPSPEAPGPLCGLCVRRHPARIVWSLPPELRGWK